MGKEILIFINVLLVTPFHVTHNGLLVQQHNLIEVLLFSGVETIVNNSPPPCGIWIYLPPQSQTIILSRFHVFSHWMIVIVVWNIWLQFSEH